MKINKYLKIASIALFATVASCDEYDPSEDVKLDAVSFVKASETFEVSETENVYQLGVSSTVKSNQDRTYTVELDEEASDYDAEDVVYPSSITIPADSYVGYGDVTFDYDQLTSGEIRTLTFNLVLSEGSESVYNNTRTSTEVNYVPLCEDNEVVIDLVFDDYAEETYWQIYDSTLSTVLYEVAEGVYDGQTSATEQLCIEDGDYYLVLWDAYGDGFCCTYGDGSYSVSVNGEVVESGTGEFGQYLIIPLSL